MWIVPLAMTTDTKITSFYFFLLKQSFPTRAAGAEGEKNHGVSHIVIRYEDRRLDHQSFIFRKARFLREKFWAIRQ